MSTINANVGGGRGGFDGTSISSGGVSNATIIAVTADDQKTLYVNDVSQLPSPVGDTITLSQAILGGKNIVRFTQGLDLVNLVIDIPFGDVQIDSNRTLSNQRNTNGLLLKTNAPGKALISSNGKEYVIKNMILSNTGLNGSCINAIGSGIFDIESIARLSNVVFYDSDEVGFMGNFFIIDGEEFGYDNIRNKGLKMGNATYPPFILFEASSFFQFNEITNGDHSIEIDTTLSPVVNVINVLSSNAQSSATFACLSVSDISKVLNTLIKQTNFTGSGQALDGFDGESGGVIVADCTGVINTPTTPYIEYKDLATQAAPIALAFNVDTKLTNDGLNGIDKHVPSTITELWDVVSNKIVLSDIPLGRLVSVVVSLRINTTQRPTVINLFGKGLDGPATIFNSDSMNINRSGVYISVEKTLFIKVSTVGIQTNGVEIKLNLSDPLTSSGLVHVDRIMPILL